MQQQAEFLVLQYAANPCYVTVDEARYVIGLYIEDNHWRWSYDERRYSVGQNRPLLHNSPREGVIGVYDRNEIEHCRSMVRAACEAIRGQYQTFTDD